MLLAIDVGNSNTSVGLFDQEKNLRFLAYLDTDSRKTADQISIDLMNLFSNVSQIPFFLFITASEVAYCE